jgi:hypothetical protein
MCRKPGYGFANGNCAGAASGGGAFLVRDTTGRDGFMLAVPAVAALHAPAGDGHLRARVLRQLDHHRADADADADADAVDEDCLAWLQPASVLMGMRDHP